MYSILDLLQMQRNALNKRPQSAFISNQIELLDEYERQLDMRNKISTEYVALLRTKFDINNTKEND